MQLQVEHHALASRHVVRDDRRPLGAEQLEADLDPARDAGEPGDQRLGLGAARHVEHRDQAVSGIERHAAVYPTQAIPRRPRSTPRSRDREGSAMRTRPEPDLRSRSRIFGQRATRIEKPPVSSTTV
jgi:hypothetical protein